MTRWLYNSDGDAIAYISSSSVYTPSGDFVGKLYEDNTIWNGDYLGQIWADDRLIFDANRLHGTRGLPGLPTLPGFVGEPPFKGPISVPLGYLDVEF